MTTQELVERLRNVSEWKQIIERHRRITDDPRISYVLKDGTRVHEDEDVIAKLAASLSRALEDAASVSDAAASRLSEMEAENKRLEKERAYAVRWGEGAVESVKEVMWRYEDALKRIAEMDAHQSSSGWDMSRIARAALEHQQKGEKL
jgi:hypothetical protein